MKDLITKTPLHISADKQLERSRWYGPNLFTFLTRADETDGEFSLLRCTLRKGFEPPLHIHTREDESYVILAGEVKYQIGDRLIHAKPGDYVLSPKNIPHKFNLVTDTATFLLLITPAGFDELFMQFSRPAQALELPPIPSQLPGKEFFEAMTRFSAELGVTMLPDL